MTDSDKERVMRRLVIPIAVIVVALCSQAPGIDYATQFNNGSKLLLKEATDSLFYVYYDNGDVRGDVSDGDEDWEQFVMIEDHDYPAIAADSTDKRWIVARKPHTLFSYDRQDLYYFSGGSWQSVTLYTAGAGRTLGPACLAGASSTTTGIVYSAFRIRDDNNGVGNIILTKFNGTTVTACSLANFQYDVGDPAVAIEPYKADSDRVLVVWENEYDDDIRYAYCVDGRSSGIAPLWTYQYGMSGAVSRCPSICAERGRTVVVWEKDADDDEIYDVYAREWSGGEWQAMQNLSNNANYSSEYPTIALGDTAVVTWSATLSGSHHHIVACINFGTIDTVVDTTAHADFPHVAFQNKYDAEGDTFIPYAHVLWSSAYYDPCYRKINLTQFGGEGQQSAASFPTAAKPSLASCEPNPFHGRTQISYALPAASNVSLGVYDATGRPVRTLASGHQTAGHYSVSWDARDAVGKRVPCGVYFYRLDTPGFVSMKQAVVAR
jgi:hypothetical protein